MRKILLIIGLLLPILLFSQGESSEEEGWFKKHWDLGGYIKYLNTTNVLKKDSVLLDNLFHNRINIEGYFRQRLTVAVEFRNQLFLGETVKAFPGGYGSFLDVDDGVVDMTWVWLDKNAVAGQTIIDRAYLNYSKGNWDIGLGRQRINWGVNLVWNPNDLFNSYQIIDFDYEERPGSDALRVQYFTKNNASIEVAFKAARDANELVGAIKYRFNKNLYDYQFLVASYETDIAFGMGWAGSIKNAGFKGEATYFQPRMDFFKTRGVFSGSIEFDYAFRKEVYLSGAFLVNTGGVNSSVLPPVLLLYSQELSARNLTPSKYSNYVHLSGTFTPGFTGGFTAIYMYGLNMAYLMPTLAYAISNNWEVDLTSQIFMGESQDEFEHFGSSVVVRLRFSY